MFQVLWRSKIGHRFQAWKRCLRYKQTTPLRCMKQINLPSFSAIQIHYTLTCFLQYHSHIAIFLCAISTTAEKQANKTKRWNKRNSKRGQERHNYGPDKNKRNGGHVEPTRPNVRKFRKPRTSQRNILIIRGLLQLIIYCGSNLFRMFVKAILSLFLIARSFWEAD